MADSFKANVFHNFLLNLVFNHNGRSALILYNSFSYFLGNVVSRLLVKFSDNVSNKIILKALNYFF